MYAASVHDDEHINGMCGTSTCEEGHVELSSESGRRHEEGMGLSEESARSCSEK